MEDPNKDSVNILWNEFLSKADELGCYRTNKKAVLEEDIENDNYDLFLTTSFEDLD